MTAALRTEDPAVAAAMGRCLLARSIARQGEDFAPTQRHPRACGWCDYPVPELEAAVREFNTWAEYDDRRSTSGRHATRAFTHDLSREQQEALIVAAQAFVDEPVTVAVPPAPDVEEPIEEEEISWLR